MEALNQQRCYHHPHREAAACCPACSRFFCRECVTEHDDRMLCRDCLAQLAGEKRPGTRRWQTQLVLWMQGIGGFLMIWYLFYIVARMLLAIPDEFHEGTIWQTDWWRKP